MTESDVYKIGRIGKTHGVKGEMLFTFTDDVFDRTDADYLVLMVDGLLVPFFIDEYRFRGNETALLRLDGIDTQEKARRLTNCDVYFPYSMSDGEEMPAMTAVVGFTMVDDGDDAVIGEITSIDDSTQNMLFEVSTADDRRLLIPVAEEYIKDVFPDKRQIRVRLPDGLLDING